MNAENPVHENVQYNNGSYSKKSITDEYIEEELGKSKNMHLHVIRGGYGQRHMHAIIYGNCRILYGVI